MADEVIGYFRGETVVGVATEHRLSGQAKEERFGFVIEGSEAADFTTPVQVRSVVKPLAYFAATLVVSDGRGATDNGLKRQVMVVPKPAKNEEGKPETPACGKDDLGLWASG